MYSLCSVALAALLLATSALASTTQTIRVCADPDNLPFSNREMQGFENRIAEMLARDLNVSIQYVWQRMGRNFVAEYLDKSRCDLLIGIPTAYRAVLTTRAYYRSTYVFVTPRKS